MELAYKTLSIGLLRVSLFCLVHWVQCIEISDANNVWNSMVLFLHLHGNYHIQSCILYEYTFSLNNIYSLNRH